MLCSDMITFQHFRGPCCLDLQGEVIGAWKWTYEGCLQSLWTHFVTLSWNFVEVWWWSLFQSTSLGKWCTSQKCAADHWSLQTLLPWSSLFMVGKAQILHGARSELNSVFGLEEVDQNPIRTSPLQSRSCHVLFLGFSNHEKEAPRQEILKWSTVCSTFSRSGWGIVRSASLTKGGTLKKRPSLHFHRVPIRSIKLSPWT
jgi:hypothetical protein